MDDMIVKQKYRYLYNDLVNIKGKLQNLIDLYDDLTVNLKNTIMVDDKIINEQSFTNLGTSKNQILSSLSNETINKIRNKL